MTLREFVSMIRRRLGLILGVAAAVVAVVTVGSLLVPKAYDSTATLFFSVRAPVNPITGTQDTGVVQDERSDSYAELATSFPVLKAAAKDPAVPQSAAELSDQVTVTHPPNSLLIFVTARSAVPKDAAAAATAVARETVILVEDLESHRSARPGVNQSRRPGQRRGQAPLSLIKASVAEPGRTPTAPASPRIARNIALSIIAGLIFGLIAAIVREIFDRRIRSPEGIRNTLDLPVLATVDFDKRVESSPLLLSHEDLNQEEIAQERLADVWSHSLLAEEYRQLRVNLQFIEFENDRRSIIVTSSKSAEGKTTTAGNLAITHALAGESVVLVDCDLRRPKVAKSLGIHAEVGLTDVLIGRSDLKSALVPGRRLSVLPAGKLPPNPTELLGSQAMADLLDQLHAEFSTVIIDTPPCLPFADVSALAPLCGAVLLVVRMGHTNSDELERVAATLTASRARICGVVANMVTARGGGSYGYRYRYGYDYGTPPTDAASGFGDLVPRGRRV